MSSHQPSSWLLCALTYSTSHSSSGTTKLLWLQSRRSSTSHWQMWSLGRLERLGWERNRGKKISQRCDAWVRGRRENSEAFSRIDLTGYRVQNQSFEEASCSPLHT